MKKEFKKVANNEVKKVANNEVKKLLIKESNKGLKKSLVDHAKISQSNDLFLLKQMDRLCKVNDIEIGFMEHQKDANKFKEFRKKYGTKTILGLLTVSQKILKFENDLKFSRTEIANIVYSTQANSVKWNKEKQKTVTEHNIEDGNKFFEAVKNGNFKDYFKPLLTSENILKLSFKSSVIAYKNAPELFTTEIHKDNTERFLKKDTEKNITVDRWNLAVNDIKPA